MTKRLYILFFFVLIISGCSSSIPNINSTPKEQTNTDWNNTLGSLLPSDPVPSEIKLEDGSYLVAKLNHVRDGDTITVTNVDTSYIAGDSRTKKITELLKRNNNSIGVRFISIDAPEITNGKNEYFGKESKKAVEELLYNGTVILELDDKALFDRYDRLIAHVYTTEGISVQEYLLNNGLARVAYLYDDYKYTKKYRQAEEQARIKKLHIHSIEGYVTSDENGGFDMSVPNGSDWVKSSEIIPFEDVLKGMKEIEWRDLFKFGVDGTD